jgi:two-component system nitrogen regulation response regulator NtrX
MRQVAATDNKVMILGETGTGKELVARAIHRHSLRHDKRLGILNCNHKAPDLVESELFGHTRGAFTGAVESRIGLFEYANGGTVFLDEIGDLDVTTQAKLLRVLETGEFQRVGATDMGTTDVRLLCATHCDLPDMVAQHKFRQDLYYRLKGIQIVLPPLRDRREDIEPLIETFSARFTIESGIPPKLFDRAAKEYMMEHNWPGNVRQLLDAVESLIVLTDSEVIFEADVAGYLRANPHPRGKRPQGLTERIRDQERTWIIEALLRANRNITATAKILEIDRSTLQKKIKSHGIDITLIGNDRG